MHSKIQVWSRTASIALLLWGCFASSLAAQPRRALVPATQEIEILDPGVDPVGNPAVLVGPDGPGGRQVDIPPAVLVHRFYYTGNRSFQGPMLPGGPSIVVVMHPVTHERMYVDVNLLPGAPIVHYTPNHIEYDYGNRGITLIFQRRGQVDVSYRHMTPAGRIVGNGFAGVARGGVGVLRRTGVGDVARGAAGAVAGTAGAAMDGVREGGKMVLGPVVNVAQAMPVLNPLISSLRDRGEAETKAAIQQRDAGLTRAQSRLDSLDQTIPTIR